MTAPYEEIPGEPALMLVADCIRCGKLFGSNPETVLSVWVNTITRCPLRPDATPIEAGEAGAQREPLCDRCAAILRAAADFKEPTPLDVTFPHARIDLIERPG